MDLRYPILAFLLLILCSCDDVVDVIPDNEPTSDFNISDIKIENYVNRLYIDLIGREPTDIELQVNFDSLKATNLGREKRQEIITKLMTDTTPQINEGSYKEAFYLNLYNRAKVRCLENITDASIRQERGITKGGALRDSLNMQWKKYYQKQDGIRRYDLLLRSREDLQEGRITYTEMMSVVIDNPIYDKINMNTFNYVRATFDELLWRLPTEQEYNASFDMIEHALTRELFEQFGSDKDAYIAILTQSWGMKEGMVIWAFQSFLNRFPESDELYSVLAEFATSDDINYVIAEILLTDEYANFR